MKKVRYLCDACGERIDSRITSSPSEHVVRAKMVTHGYGMGDGIHELRGHICSWQCGLKMLREWIASIDPAEAKDG